LAVRLVRLLGLVPFAVALATPVTAPRAAGPSFDCAKETGLVERAICASPKLSRLDVRLDAAYRKAMRGWSADPITRDALRTAQRDFLDRREDALAADGGLAGLYEAQVLLLETLDTAPRAGFDGEWSNLAGALRVYRTDAGLMLYGNAVEPVRFRWVCDTDIGATVSGTTLVAPPEAGKAGFAEWSIRMERVAGTARLREVGPPGTPSAPDGTALGDRPHCGMRGRFDGVYFPTKEKMKTN
jgi:uncharacterized protein